MLTLLELQQGVISLNGGLGILVDPQGRVLGLNPLATQVLGVAQSPLNQLSDVSVLLGFAALQNSDTTDSPFEQFFKRYLQDRPLELDNTSWIWTYAVMPLDSARYYVLIGNKLPKHLQLDKEQKLFRDIINNIPQYIFWKDRQSVFLGCNNNFAQLVGLDFPEQIVGKTDYDFSWSDEQTELYREDDQKVMRSRVPKLYYEEQQTDVSGNVHDVLVSKIPLYADERREEVIGLVCIYQDITDKKRLEKALLKAKTRAEAANRAKSEFIANMSHDIRTPITGMLGLAQFLKDRSNTKESAECSQLLIDSTEELLKLLNEVIEIIHLESATQAPKSELFYLPDLIAHNLTLLAPAAKHKGLSLDSQLSPTTPCWLMGPRTYLDRILLNVLSNAVKFTNEGGVSITVTSESLSTSQVELVLQVRDTGIGIPANRRADIFDRYSRVTPSYDGIYKGSGIGLYVVKKYLDEIQGTVEVDSMVDQGSCFTLRIPFELGEAQQQPVPVPAAANLLPAKQAHRTQILIVEDNPLAARMAMQVMEKLSCECHLASSGGEALAWLAEAPVDLILMDIGLPGESGYELARKIRAMPALAALPIIALTGHLGSKQKAACIDAGMQDVVIKPISLEGAQALLQRWAGRQQVKLPGKNAQATDLEASVDLVEGAELSGGSEVAARELISLLVSSLPDTVATIERHFAAKQWQELSDEVHKLYGGLCYVGVPKLRHIVKQLDHALQQGHQLDGLAAHIEALTVEATRILGLWDN